MNVQGDYEPTDAGGFIKINALRSVLTYLKCVSGISPLLIFVTFYLPCVTKLGMEGGGGILQSLCLHIPLSVCPSIV